MLITSEPASAYYIGPSYLRIPGIDGDARHQTYAGWVRAEASYWTKRPALREIRGINGHHNGLQFTGPRAPDRGPETLTIAVDKLSAAHRPLLEACRRSVVLPEITFAESSDLLRHPQERGPRPADVPDYYEYTLSGVTLTCPVVEEAPEQAFTLNFQSIQWLNYRPQPVPRAIEAMPAALSMAPTSGTTRVFVLTWFAPVSDSKPDQCPTMNAKPKQEDYFALMSPQRAREQRAFLADKGGANTTVLPYRGPDELNVTMLPGIVADPGHALPETDVVRGFDLDGDDGSGPAPPHTRPHRNYLSPDGRNGIDNQLFTVQGCIEGWRRHGFLPMIANELRHAGGLSILVEVSGIDDSRDDDDVAVTILYSETPMRKSGSSKAILPDFTFKVSQAPEYTQDFVRFRGRMKDGIVITETLPAVHLHEGPSAMTWSMMQARMQLDLTVDGKLTALLGGYRDLRQYLAAALFRSSDYENTIGFQAPGLYNAVRRAADGLMDPVTGEFTGISAAYEMEGIRAFLPPSQQRQLLAGESHTSAPRQHNRRIRK
jgi:type VI protein secretion system component Hcp